MFCFESVARYSEMNPQNHMTLPAVLDLFQDCCVFQSEELGVGVDYLMQAHRAWALSSWQVVLNRYPVMGEKIRTFTWPYDFKNFLGYRNFKMESADGEILAYANSVWVYLDTESGRPVRAPEELTGRYSFEQPYEMKSSGRKIRLPEDMQPKEPVRIGRFHIDTNRHVNNGKYVRIAEEYLPEGFQTMELRAEYKKQAVLHDIIYPKVREEPGKAVVSLENQAQEAYAVIEFMEGHV